MPLRYWEDGAEIVRQDLSAVAPAVLREIYDRIIYEMNFRYEDAFFGDSFQVSFSAANQVIVKKGNGFQTDSSQVSPQSQKRLLYLAADTSKVISTPDGSQNRIDIVCVKANVVDELTGTRKFKDATTSVVTNETLVVQQDWQADILIVDGTPSGSPAAPAVPSGYVKIAELLVTAISGLSGSGAITDKRKLMPNQNYIDVLIQASNPANPDAGYGRLFYKGGVLYVNEAGSVTPIGSGGGGGGGANWQPVAGAGPVEDFEFNEKVWKYSSGGLQSLELWVRVPSSYISGRQPSVKFGFYSPSAADQWKMQGTATLIRKNTDAINSAANQNIANSGDITNTLSNKMVECSILLSSSVGTINSVAISPGDIIKIQLERIAPSGTDDSADVRFIPSSTEVIF